MRAARRNRAMTGAFACALVACLMFVATAEAARIEVTAKITHSTAIAFPPAGRAGDAEAQQWVVRDRYGNAIGDMLIDCRWVTSGLRLCVGQMSLPRGVLAMIGASRTRFVGQLAIVGGTGHYDSAGGTMLFKATGTGRYVLSVQYETKEG